MSVYESLIEDDELFREDDEADDEYFMEDDEADDEASSRGKKRRAPRIRVGRTASGRNLFKRPAPSGTVTTASLQASLDRVGNDMRANAKTIRDLGAQVKSAVASLTSVNNKQDSSISDLRSELRKQGGGFAQTNQLNMLLPLLQKAPELEARVGADPESAATVLASVQVKKQDNTLPLVIAMMGAFQPGGNGNSSNQMNMMLPMLLLMDR